MKKLFYLMIFFSSLAYSQYGDAYHKPDTYRLEQMRQDRMNQNDAAHRANVNSSNSGSSASNTNSGTGVSAAQHWEDVKNSNKKVVYTQAELEAAKIAKDLKKKNEEDRINANNRSEVERIQGYLDTADDTSLPSSERLEALDRYMSYFDMKYQRANARADHSSELLKKAYIYFNDENYQKAYENFRIPDNTDQKTKNEINSLKTYCTFLMYEEKSVEEIEDLYKTQKEWSIPLAYVYYLNGNEEKSFDVLENHLKTVTESEAEKTKNRIFLAALYAVFDKNELALKTYNSNSKTPVKSKTELTKTTTDYLAFTCDDNINNYKFIRISTLFGLELQKRLLPNDKSIVEKSLKINQKLNRKKEIEEDKSLLGDKSFMTKKQRLEVRKQQEIESKIASEKWEKDKSKREAEAIAYRKNNQHPKYFNQVTEEQKTKGYKQYDNIVDLCNNLYKTKIIELAEQNNFTDDILGEQNDKVKGLKIYYKDNCLTTYLQRFNVTSFDNGYLDAKSCSRSFEFDNIKDRDNEYDQIIKDIKKSKQYKNIKDNYYTKGHLEEVKFKSIENAIYSNTFINIEMYKKEQSNNGKYELYLLVEIDE